MHICCGPCAITVLRHLLEHGHEPTGFFFNPNIHPLAEYMRRREGVAQVAGKLGVPVIFADSLPLEEQFWSDPWLSERTGLPDSAPPADQQAPLPGTLYTRSGNDKERPGPFAPGRPPAPPAANPVPWLRAVSGREESRCLFCWRVRLVHSARAARRLGLDALTSSLLYSRFQDHDRIRELGESAADAAGLLFLYQDFRRFWQQGIDASKEWGIYRQPYCGCLFSEYERYSKPFARALADG